MYDEIKAKKDEYLQLATSWIPGRLEKMRVRAELEDHLEELAAEYRALDRTEDEAISCAIGQMGNPKELAVSLGNLHGYDSARAYSRMAVVLWLGVLLSAVSNLILFWFGPVKPFLLCNLIGDFLFLAALLRLKELRPALKKGFLLAVFCMILSILNCAASALMWEQARKNCLVILTLLGTVSCIAAAYFLADGFGDLAGTEGRADLKGGFWLIAVSHIMYAVASIASIWNGIGYVWNNTEINDFYRMISFVFLGMIINKFQKAERHLTENQEAGISRCRKWKVSLLAVFLLLLLTLPAAVSARMAVYPVKTAGEVEMDPEKRNDADLRMALFARLKGSARDEVIRPFLALLPQDEVQKALSAEKVWVQESGDTEYKDTEYSSAILVSLEKKFASDYSFYSCHIGCLTEMEAPFQGYAAASSLWVANSNLVVLHSVPGQFREYLFNDNFTRLSEKAARCFFYEKDGRLFEFLPRCCFGTGISVMNLSEFSLPRNADRAYCYQTVDISYINEEGEELPWLYVAHEFSFQKSPIRLPYDQIYYEDVRQPSRYSKGTLFRFGEDVFGLIEETSSLSNLVWQHTGYGDGINFSEAEKGQPQ